MNQSAGRTSGEPVASPPLAGVRILDLSSPVGPYCGRLLADLGADVTLVEPPEGDPYRRLGPFRDGQADPEASLVFGYYHAGKTSVVLNLGAEAGQSRIAELGAEADIILISPSTRRPLWGFDPQTRQLAWASTDAIVCSITPFGIGGPYWHRPFTHATSFASGGQMAEIGEADSPPPAVPAEIHWHGAAAHAAVAILAALAVRDTAGGRFLDVSAQEVEAFQLAAIGAYHARRAVPGQRGSGKLIPPSGLWECADGRIDVAAYADHHWAAFLEMAGHPPELSEPSLADMAVRRQIFDGLIPVIAEILAPREREDLFGKGQAAGLPVCLRNTPAEFVADPQLAERGYWAHNCRAGGRPFAAPGVAALSRPALFRPAETAAGREKQGREPSGARAGAVAASYTANRPDRPLEGFRVLSLGTYVAGNVCAQILAGVGADVVKVENSRRPESLRGGGYNDSRRLAQEPSGATNTPLNACLSRGAKNVGLDLFSDRGQQALRELAANSDAVIENFGAAVMAGWGAGFDELRRLNPKLIMVSMSGYGRTGTRGSSKAYASSIASHTGLSEAWWNSGTLTDYVTAAHAALAVLAARIHVAASGQAVYVDAAQTEVFAAMAARVYLGPLNNGDSAAPGHLDEGALLTRVVRCDGDDRWAIIEIEDIAQWNAACEVVEREDLALDPSLPEKPDVGLLSRAIDDWALRRTPRSVGHVMTAAGVPAASVANSEEVYDDPQLASRGFLEEVPHPDLGRLVLPGSPQRLSGQGGAESAFAVAPSRLGQHSRQILQEWAGMSPAAIDDLVAAGAATDAGP